MISAHPSISRRLSRGLQLSVKFSADVMCFSTNSPASSPVASHTLRQLNAAEWTHTCNSVQRGGSEFFIYSVLNLELH